MKILCLFLKPNYQLRFAPSNKNPGFVTYMTPILYGLVMGQICFTCNKMGWIRVEPHNLDNVHITFKWIRLGCPTKLNRFKWFDAWVFVLCAFFYLHSNPNITQTLEMNWVCWAKLYKLDRVDWVKWVDQCMLWVMRVRLGSSHRVCAEMT